MLEWTIGAGGLIGSAIARQCAESFTFAKIPWRDPDAAVRMLSDGLDAFANRVRNAPWSIIWAAGAATIAAPETHAQAEAALFTRFCQELGQARLPKCGVVTVISSAGAIHTGSINPPFDEQTPPAPTSPYGRARLAQETAAHTLLAQRWPVILARVSNVYGPGQDVEKLQGIISRIAVCSLTRTPLNLFVPLSTVRDYIYVDDVAERLHAWIRHDLHTAPSARVRVIASGQGSSIGQVIRTAQDVGHRRVPIAMGTHPSAPFQAADSRFIPSIPDSHPPLALTPLPIGMKAVFDDILWRITAAVA